MRTHKLLTPLLLATGLAALSSSTLLAQEYHNTTERIDGNWASASPTVTFGPNANITINGDWYLTANTVTIDPGAIITGTGTLHIMTPATYDRPATATTLNAGGTMGNGLGIGCMVSLENGGLAGTIALAGANDLVMNNNLSFAKTGAHLILGARNLVYRSGAAATSVVTTVPATPVFNNQPADAAATFRDAYAVTNGAGLVGKQNLATNAVFTYTIGQSAAAGSASDYTPATIQNDAPAPRTISARVQTYAASAPVEGNVITGVNRTWQVVGSTDGNAIVSLTHNANSEAANFNRNAAFVTQANSAGGFSIGTPMPFTAPNFTNTENFNVPASGTALSSYFSKSSDSINSLNPTVNIAAKLFLQGPYLGSGSANTMTNFIQTGMGGTFSGCKLPTTDPYGLGTTYTEACNVAGPAGAVTDWVREELWGFNGGTSGVMLQSRAALLKTNGQAVGIDGTAVGFRVAPGFASYRLVVRNRNHMAISSQDLTGVADGAAITYDFTDAASKARNTQSGTPQQSNIGSVFALFAGDVNQDFFVDAQDRTLLNNNINAGTSFDVYDVNDINHEGTIDAQDRTLLNNNINFSTLFSEVLTY